MDEVKRRYKVTIDNRSYTIITTNSAEHMQAVLKVINKQLAQIKEKMPQIDPQQAAILLALNAVSDQLGLQYQLDEIEIDRKQND